MSDTPEILSRSAQDPAKGNQRKVHVKTWGCQMNVYDSTRMGDVLGEMGYGLTDEAAEADLVILNTCHIREKASEKLFSELGRLKEYQQERKARDGSRMMLAVAGCVAQAEGAEIIRRAPHVDLVFGPQTYHQLPEMVGQAMRKGGVVNTEFPTESKFDHLPDADVGPQTLGSPSAFLSVQEGCDKFCSFCVVPYTRGAEVSRSPESLLLEAEKMLAKGVREITLLGQNVNAYHGTAANGTVWSLARLIEGLAKLSGLQRIRYMTSHPRDMADDLIAAHRDIPALMPYLHLPVQSGSNRILAAMNRKHDRDLYLRIVEKLRAAKSDMALTSDFIVGFPGETEADFEDTMRLVDEVGFAMAYSFTYSARPGTPASGLPELPEAVKHERLLRLQEMLWQQQRHFNARLVGQTIPILLEKKGKKEGQLLGKSPWLQSVPVAGEGLSIGQIVQVKIEAAHQTSLAGIVVGVESPLTRVAS